MRLQDSAILIGELVGIGTNAFVPGFSIVQSTVSTEQGA
jgi:hypothetical protein